MSASIFSSVLKTAGLALFGAALCACGGGDDDTPPRPIASQCKMKSERPAVEPRDSQAVQYKGSTLVVFGIEYPLSQISNADCVGGELIVTVKEGQFEDATRQISEFPVQMQDAFFASIIYVTVPLGYEEQWRRALEAQPFTRSSQLNMVLFIAGNR